MEPAKITMKPSIIIKLWIKRQDKDSICADERTMAKVDEYKSSFPVLENLVKKERIIPKEFYPFRLALYSKDDLDTQKFVEKPNFDFFQKKLIGRQSHNISTNDPEAEFSPIIHVIQKESERENFIKDEFLAIHPNAPRSRAIVDSSIWNYFVCPQNDIKTIIDTIYRNYSANYYCLLIAKEYADLNARIATMAYLYEKPLLNQSTTSNAQSAPIENTSFKSGHGKDVSPFLFHSERNLAAKREEEYKEKLEGKVYDFKKYKWRVLLVDDRINGNYLKPYNLKVCKESIIENRIKSILWEGCYCKCVYDLEKYKSTPIFDDEGREPDMVILCVDSIEKAKDALKNYKFDFILLDYLLERYKDEDRKEIERHYGYELLTDLADEKNGIGKDCAKDITPYLHYNEGKQYIVGPDHRYFFMFISAFTTAISERLRLLGYSRSEELWHIAEGACPTNTPELFCYNLQKMMVKRIKDSGMEKLNPDEMLKLAEKIFHKAEKGESSVRKRANENYQAILGLLYHYNRILNDVEIPLEEKLIFSIRESVLMTSFMKDHENFGGLLEHLVHLVHLTAFGTARQWSEMWEEYIYVKNQFMDLFKERLDKTITLMIADKEQTILIKEALEKLYNSIEEYILELKRIN